jgi:hypothetical protein
MTEENVAVEINQEETTPVGITSEVAITELYKAFRHLNERYYEGKLPEPFIVILETARKNAYGWFTPDKIWKDANGEIEMHEIAMSAEYMNRGTYLDIIQTLHHEMVHLYCHVNDIKDTRKKGKYHNEKFKEACLEKGFKFDMEEPDDKLGWYKPLLTDEAIETIRSFGLNEDAFKIARAIRAKKPRKANKSKYECPNCEIKLRGKSGLAVSCTECEMEMIEFPVVPKQ